MYQVWSVHLYYFWNYLEKQWDGVSVWVSVCRWVSEWVTKRVVEKLCGSILFRESTASNRSIFQNTPHNSCTPTKQTWSSFAPKTTHILDGIGMRWSVCPGLGRRSAPGRVWAGAINGTGSWGWRGAFSNKTFPKINRISYQCSDISINIYVM